MSFSGKKLPSKVPLLTSSLLVHYLVSQSTYTFRNYILSNLKLFDSLLRKDWWKTVSIIDRKKCTDPIYYYISTFCFHLLLFGSTDFSFLFCFFFLFLRVLHGDNMSDVGILFAFRQFFYDKKLYFRYNQIFFSKNSSSNCQNASS